jgi:hypothetical protein
MPYHRDDELPVIGQPACIHLRSKAMYVTGEMNPAHMDERANHWQHCWCNRTQHTVGPDQATVGRSDCVPGRDCYVA